MLLISCALLPSPLSLSLHCQNLEKKQRILKQMEKGTPLLTSGEKRISSGIRPVPRKGSIISLTSDGEKKKVYANGSTFVGGLDERGRRHGQGMMQFKDGTYDGSWKNGKQHGWGKYEWNSGSAYEGKKLNCVCDRFPPPLQIPSRVVWGFF